jgi:hypothetical protein
VPAGSFAGDHRLSSRAFAHSDIHIGTIFEGATVAQETIVIPARFRGPPTSGNGGYVCGAFGELLTHGNHALPDRRAAQVTLRSPIPLDTPMTVERAEDTLTIHHGETLIAQAQIVVLELAVPPAPSFEEAHAVRDRSPAFARNASRHFPDKIGFHPLCFCCGVEHADDGLHVTAAPLRDNAIVAAAWETQPRWADDSGHIPPRFLWTALDCPGQFAFYAGGIRTGMLGQLAARIEHPVRAGERCVVTGWRIAVEGKRHYAGTAVFGEDGRLCAYARAIWVGRRDA